MTTKATLAAAGFALVVGAGCGVRADLPAARVPSTNIALQPSPSVAQSSSPSGASGNDQEPRVLPRLVHVGSLPSQGVVVAARHVVTFLDLDGETLRTLRGSDLHNASASPGRIVIARRSAYYVLHAGSGVLRLLRSEREAYRYTGQNEEVVGATPASRYMGHPEGHWRWAIRSPTGAMTLAQWSGECEVPTAFLWDGDDAPGIPITGEQDLARAPESLGLGWTLDGRAIALMGEGLCSEGTRPPGVYLFSDAAQAHLLSEVPRGGASARMWGSAGTAVAGEG